MTSDRPPDSLEALLLDGQMDLLDPAERDRLERALSRDPALRAKRARLAKVLKPLEAWTSPPAPPNLVQSVMGHLQASSRTIPLEPSASLPPSGAEASMMPALMSLREVVGVAAAILIIVGVFVPSYYGVRQRSQRAACATNLYGIGLGAQQYAADHRGYLPFAGARFGASWLRRSPSDANGLSNTRHPFLLIRKRYVLPKLMVCPSDPQASPISVDQCDDLDDFQTPNQISYSWQVPFKPLLQVKLNNQFAIAADHTPYVKDGRVRLLTVDPSANSAAHGDNAGQNVLYPDGRVVWRWTPRCGVNRDNIWLAGQLTEYTGVERPHDGNDSFLVSP